MFAMPLSMNTDTAPICEQSWLRLFKSRSGCLLDMLVGDEQDSNGESLLSFNRVELLAVIDISIFSRFFLHTG